MGELICDVADLHQIDKEWLGVTETIFESINNYKG